jgi:8-oxo-dGTP pyrophosphatase MutT (NUDIX family)
MRGTSLEFSLITTRGSGRWIIPKGWLKPGQDPWVAAAHEAFEEAGLSGEIGVRPIGTYQYIKNLHYLASAVCRVDVFPLLVTDEHSTWPEVSGRRRAWFDTDAAAATVSDAEVGEIILSFSASTR